MRHETFTTGELAFAPRLFTDRRAAGRALARALQHHAATKPVVLGLSRGGVPVADEVARALGATLDVLVVRKLGAPTHHDLGLGAVAEGPTVIVDRSMVDMIGISHRKLDVLERRERAEVQRRVARFRAHRRSPDLAGRTVVLVDDGIATGGTMRAAIRAVRKQPLARLVIAVPVATPDTLASLRPEVDEIVCLQPTSHLHLCGIGLWYEDFREVTDDDVAAILARAGTRAAA